MRKVQAVVLNNEVLGCLSDNRRSIEPLSDLRRTVTTNHSSPITTFNKADIRNATLDDFKRFRVQYNENYLID